MRPHVLSASVVSLALIAPLPARAYVPEKTPRRYVEASARRLIAHPAANPGTPGLAVMRGGRLLWSRNADRPMTPASLLKLATTTAAMVRWGPKHRFATRALVDGKGGNVDRLFLVGGGDPTFSTEAYRRKRFLPKPSDAVRRPAFASGSPTVEQLAARIVRAGVRSVGVLLADDTLFDARREQRGWLPTYLTSEPDTGLLSALTVNEGMADLEREHILPSPSLGAGDALKRALQRRGVSVGAVVTGRAPDGSDEIARVESPPLAEIVDFVNRYSINYEAELLLKGLGAAFGGRGSTEAGAAIVRATLAELDVPLEGFRMEDGSGLSVLDRATPRTIAAILRAIATRRGEPWDVLRSSIPVAGEPGTLLKRMRAQPAGHNLRGKTGQIRRVRAMAGWVTATDGVPIVYVAMLNDVRRPFALTDPLDLFGVMLALSPG